MIWYGQSLMICSSSSSHNCWPHSQFCSLENILVNWSYYGQSLITTWPKYFHCSLQSPHCIWIQLLYMDPTIVYVTRLKSTFLLISHLIVYGSSAEVIASTKQRLVHEGGHEWKFTYQRINCDHCDAVCVKRSKMNWTPRNTVYSCYIFGYISNVCP